MKNRYCFSSLPSSLNTSLEQIQLLLYPQLTSPKSQYSRFLQKKYNIPYKSVPDLSGSIYAGFFLWEFRVVSTATTRNKRVKGIGSSFLTSR